MGFLWLAVIGIAAAGGLWLLGVARAMWSLAGAALMLGAIGYSWQAHPFLTGSPARPDAIPGEVEPAMVDLRNRLLGNYTADTSYFVTSDALIRAGDADSAARVMMGGVRALPRSFILWIGLGSTLAARDGDQVSPAALLAFQQAARLAPEHPAPPFYLGLAYARSGDLVRARALWRRAIALCPPDASYRKDIALLLAIVDGSLANAASGGEAPTRNP